MNMKTRYEIREIDAWLEDERMYSWNASYHISEYETNAKNGKRAFLNALKKHGITCKRGTCYVDFDGDIYELRRRDTHEPYYAAIPLE